MRKVDRIDLCPPHVCMGTRTHTLAHIHAHTLFHRKGHEVKQVRESRE